jgi:UDP-N-acetylmuramoyl-tripeptide--D-alanyl-D-alanine ligase
VTGMAARTSARVMTFGRGDGADVRVGDVTLDETGRARFRLHTPAGDADVALGVHGAHQALNAAAVVAAGLAAGLELADIVSALATAGPRSPHRMHVQRRPDGLVVIDDAYNANPESVRAAVDALTAIAGGRRRWAVLGEMRELGPESADLHREVGGRVAAAGVEQLLVVGPDAPYGEGAAAATGWTGQVREVADVDRAVRLLRDEVSPADVVLVKASNALRLWTVAESLLGDQASRPTEASA